MIAAKIMEFFIVCTRAFQSGSVRSSHCVLLDQRALKQILLARHSIAVCSMFQKLTMLKVLRGNIDILKKYEVPVSNNDVRRSTQKLKFIKIFKFSNYQTFKIIENSFQKFECFGVTGYSKVWPKPELISKHHSTWETLGQNSSK